MTEWTSKYEAPVLPVQEYRGAIDGMDAQIRESGTGYFSWYVWAALDEFGIMASGSTRSLDDAKAACEAAAAKLASIGATGRKP